MELKDVLADVSVSESKCSLSEISDNIVRIDKLLTLRNTMTEYIGKMCKRNGYTMLIDNNVDEARIGIIPIPMPPEARGMKDAHVFIYAQLRVSSLVRSSSYSHGLSYEISGIGTSQASIFVEYDTKAMANVWKSISRRCKKVIESNNNHISEIARAKKDRDSLTEDLIKNGLDTTKFIVEAPYDTASYVRVRFYDGRKTISVGPSDVSTSMQLAIPQSRVPYVLNLLDREGLLCYL